MITDNQTNFLYLADCLPKKYPGFCALFLKALESCSIPVDWIPGTKDIWAVDYMPLQVRVDKLVRFIYDPNYLKGAKKWQETISDVEGICEKMKLDALNSRIVLDGGNVVRTADKVILFNKVFRENPSIPEKQLIQELESLFEVDRIIFVPQAPGDLIGHADGMVRFLDDRNVVINDFSGEQWGFQVNFRTALHNAGLEFIEIPYHPYANKGYLDATGIYINYLQMSQAVLVPVFGTQEDEQALKQLEQLFLGQTVRAVPANEIARQGGMLNCITWNVAKLL